jgi:hypothetical protein
MIKIFSFALALMTTTLATAEAPTIAYRTSGGAESRKLIFVNNPEVLLASLGYCDIADNMSAGSVRCARSLHHLEGAIGNFRNWFEHTNGTLKPLKYAVRVSNPGQKCAVVRVRGLGFSENAVKSGGREFVDMFNNYGATEHTLCPGKFLDVLLTSNEQVVPAGKFLAGVVDFDIEQEPLNIDNLAFFNEPADTLNPLGYTQRVVLNVREGLVYKGVSDDSEAIAENINFQIDDGTPVGRLPVRHPSLILPEQHNPPTSEGHCSVRNVPVCTGEQGAWGENKLRDTWVTHIAPVPNEKTKRMNGVVTDQITLYTPGYPEGCNPLSDNRRETCFAMSPFYKWWYQHSKDWEYPNWGNWAVHYKLRGIITNTGTRARTVHLGVRGDGNSPIAYKGQDNAWKHTPLTKAADNDMDDYFPYSTFVVQPGESKPYWGDIILSGPAAGTLQNLVKIVN